MGPSLVAEATVRADTAGLLEWMASLAVILYTTMGSGGSFTFSTFSGFSKVYMSAVVSYLAFGFYYIPYIARFWSPNKFVDRLRYEGTRAVDVDDEQRQRSHRAYQQATQIASRLGVRTTVSPEPRLSARGKALIFASCALAVIAFLSPTLFPQMVVALSASGLMMLPFYIGIVFLLISSITGSWRFLYKMMF